MSKKLNRPRRGGLDDQPRTNDLDTSRLKSLQKDRDLSRVMHWRSRGLPDPVFEPPTFDPEPDPMAGLDRPYEDYEVTEDTSSGN